MRGAVLFVSLFFGVLAVGGVGVTLLSTDASHPVGDPQVRGWEGPFDAGTYIEVKGMAHYAATLTQRTPGTWLHDPAVHHVYGLFAPMDASGREIRLLIRTPRPPERLVSYEVMTVRGMVQPLLPETIPANSETLMSERAGYWFADDVFVIEPVWIESEGEVWTPADAEPVEG